MDANLPTRAPSIHSSANVSQRTPEYLRLHTEEVPQAEEPKLDAERFNRLSQSFQQVTQCQLRLAEQQPGEDVTWARAVTNGGGPWLTLKAAPESRQDAVIELASSIGEIMSQWHATQRALWRREAELATAIPLSYPCDTSEQLAQRLEAVLRCGAKSLNCPAAALYMLDDATQFLKLRASWGLPQGRLAEEPRPLKGAVADLEAMLGHAVVVEDSQYLEHWNIPEKYPAAVCVPVASDSNILGTLWLFSDTRRDFQSKETNLAEMVAGRLVADLEREILWREQMRVNDYRKLTHATAAWQRDNQPDDPPPLEHWNLEARTRSEGLLHRGGYGWRWNSDESLTWFAAHCPGPVEQAALAINTLSSIMSGLMLVEHEPHKLMALGCEALQQQLSSVHQISGVVGRLQPQGKGLDYALAGSFLIEQQTGELRTQHRSLAPFWDEGTLGTWSCGHLEIAPGEVVLAGTEQACQAGYQAPSGEPSVSQPIWGDFESNLEAIEERIAGQPGTAVLLQRSFDP